jgi:hypothetical protein
MKEKESKENAEREKEKKEEETREFASTFQIHLKAYFYRGHGSRQRGSSHQHFKSLSKLTSTGLLTRSAFEDDDTCKKGKRKNFKSRRTRKKRRRKRLRRRRRRKR